MNSCEWLAPIVEYIVEPDLPRLLDRSRCEAEHNLHLATKMPQTDQNPQLSISLASCHREGDCRSGQSMSIKILMRVAVIALLPLQLLLHIVPQSLDPRIDASRPISKHILQIGYLN